MTVRGRRMKYKKVLAAVMAGRVGVLQDAGQQRASNSKV